MPYRTPDAVAFNRQQAENHIRYAGQTAVWRQYVSASAGVAAAGFGSAPSYREQTITALFGRVEQKEDSTPAGMLANADIYAVTREKIGRQDLLTWRGTTYRVESDPSPARLTNTYMTLLKRTTP